MASALITAKAANLAEFNPAAANLLIRLDKATNGSMIQEALDSFDEDSAEG